MRDEWLAAVAAHVQRIEETRDRGIALDRATQAVALRLTSCSATTPGTAVLVGDAAGAAGGAPLDHGDRDEERGRDGGHDPAPGGRLRLGEVGGQAQQYPAREHDGGPRQASGDGAVLLVALSFAAAMTQVRSMQIAVAQAIGPCWAAVSRMWVNDPAPAMTASTVTGRALATASRCRPALTSRPAVRPVPDGRTGSPRPGAALHRCCAGAAGPPR